MIKTVVYIGSRKAFNLHNPHTACFPKGVPVSVPAAIVEYLPFDDFEEYDSEKHEQVGETKPILVLLPSDLFTTLFIVPNVERIRRQFPHNAIHLIGKKQFGSLFIYIDDLTYFESKSVRTLDYFKQFDCSKTPQTSECFNGGAALKHTLESCWMRFLRLRDTTESSKPTLLSLPTNPETMTIIIHGTQLGNVWEELGRYLSKQEWDYPLEVIDRSTKDPIEILRNSKYIISVGDSPYTMLGAFLGVPMLAFLPSREGVYPWQLDKFNNIKPQSVFINSFERHIDNGIIYNKLRDGIRTILSGKVIDPPKTDATPASIPKGRDGHTVPKSKT